MFVETSTADAEALNIAASVITLYFNFLLLS
jgi:hypothetical protein